MGYDLKGRAVVLTGGSRGIGLAVARELAAEGARIVLVARNAEKLEDAAAELGKTGAEVYAIAGDVGNDASVREMVDKAAGVLSGIDVFMNIAGITLEKALEDATIEDFRRVMDINLLGTVRCTRAVLPWLKQSRGVLVNTASVIVHQPFPRLGVYACSKWAVAAYSHTLRQELFGTGVRILTMYPTVVRTDMVDEEPVLAKSPSQTPEQCARAIVRAVRRGRANAGTSLVPALVRPFVLLRPTLADRINRMFLPPGY
ncbi:MAG: SDR family NAD(P)-dependent oxidoreductase [Desulfatibacillaceae bacterium]